MITLAVAGCGIPDISHLPPAEQLAQLDQWIAESEASLHDPTPAPFYVSPAEQALLDLGEQQQRQIIDDMKAQRAQLLVAHPELAPVGTSSGPSSGAEFAGGRLGANVSRVSLSGNCGFPASEVSEANRRLTYNDAALGTSQPAFNSQSALRGMATGIACSDANLQMQAYEAPLNGAINAAIQLRNSTATTIDLRCVPGPGSWNDSICTAVALLREAQDVAVVCHQACSGG